MTTTANSYVSLWISPDLDNAIAVKEVGADNPFGCVPVKIGTDKNNAVAVQFVDRDDSVPVLVL